ncbi:uncharacterized protein LOC143133856 isoform X2 [Alosa pseudoharengus]|uniref:uncharacterized protein LOC143133856 isoform X2 n=1 Tax=Alosa pseudoharengus TaxID=34774 RepID=UPI003F8CD17A
MKVVFLLGLLPLIGLFKEVHTQITQSSSSSAFSTNTGPQTTPVPQNAPVTEAVPLPEVKLEFKLEMTFTPELQNTSSPKFVQLASQVALALDSIYSAIFGSSFNRAEIKSFRQGSVIVDSVLIFNDVNSVPETGNVTDTLVLAASSNSSHFAPLHLNVSSIKVERSTTTPAQPSKSAAPVTAPPQTSPSTSHSTVFYPSASTAMRTTEASSAVLLSSTPAVTTLPGSCSSPTSLCCLGQNNTCFRNGCYCDEACIRLTDCCSDYNQTCSSLYPSRVIMKVRGNLNTHRGEAAFQELDFLLANKLKELCSNCEVLILNKTIMKVP